MEDDLQVQKNKRHNATRNKLDKRWKQKKDIKKEKSKKKKQYDRNGAKEKFFLQKDEKKIKDEFGVNLEKIKKRINKFLSIYDDDLEDFFEIFKSLDEGEEVDIKDIENQKTKKCLSKIFKTLKLKENNMNFKKKSGHKITFLQKYMKQKVDEVQISNQQSDSDSDNSSSSEDEKPLKKQQTEKEANTIQKIVQNAELDPKKQELIEKLQKINKKTQEQEQSEPQVFYNPQIKEIIQQRVKQTAQILTQGAQRPQVSHIGPSIGPFNPSIGPSGPSRTEQNENISDTSEHPEQEQTVQKENPNREEWMKGEWGDLEMKFNSKNKQLTSFLNKRKRVTDDKKLGTSKNIYAEGSAKLEDGNTMSQEQLQNFMEEYNTQFRPKTLMEEHREIQRQNAINNPYKDQQERSRFNRDKEMKFNTVDSKRLFQAMKDTDVLKSKFSNSKIERTFL